MMVQNGRSEGSTHLKTQIVLEVEAIITEDMMRGMERVGAGEGVVAIPVGGEVAEGEAEEEEEEVVGVGREEREEGEWGEAVGPKKEAILPVLKIVACLKSIVARFTFSSFSLCNCNGC